MALVIAALLLILLAVLFAHRKARALFFVGLGIEVLLLLVALVLIGARGWAADSLASPDGRPVLSAFVDSLAESLVLWLAWTAIAVGVVAVLGAVVGLLLVGRRAESPSPPPAET